MKIAAALRRHRRLSGLLVLSLLAHVVVIECITVRSRALAHGPLADALTIRLRPPGHPGAAQHSAATAQPKQSARAAAARRSSRTAPTGQQRQAPPQAPQTGTNTGVAAPGPAAPGDEMARMPGTYRAQMPPPALLTYATTHSGPGAAPEQPGQARIDWRNDGVSYRLRVEGVLGTLTSEGAGGDAGIEPRTAGEQRSSGALALTRIDADARRIVFELDGASAPAGMGAQDRASLLMQLAGMGLADASQINDVVEFVVAGPASASVVRFQVLGQEELATGIGACSAWHLVQLTEPGEPRLEVWLAPAHSWFPVQLRVTKADGSAATQVLTRLEPVAASDVAP